MRTNRGASLPAKQSHEGELARYLTPMLELRRSALTALLFEDTFYEKGSKQADRVAALIGQCPADAVAALAVECRSRMFLRHMPLFLIRELARIKGNGALVTGALEACIQRPDELTEY